MVGNVEVTSLDALSDGSRGAKRARVLRDVVAAKHLSPLKDNCSATMADDTVMEGTSSQSLFDGLVFTIIPSTAFTLEYVLKVNVPRVFIPDGVLISLSWAKILLAMAAGSSILTKKPAISRTSLKLRILSLPPPISPTMTPQSISSNMW